MKLTDFERVVCLCVDRRVATELPRLRKMVADHGHALTEFIAGKGELYLLDAYDMIDPTEVPSTWRGYPNSYAAFLSYQEIFRRAIKDGVESVLILEDDCEFTPEFNAVLSEVQLPEKWDMLYLGGNYQWASSTLVSKNLYRTYGIMCWHAVGIHHNAFQQIVNWQPHHPIDLQAKAIHYQGNTFGVWPNIAIQKPGVSNVEGKYRDYTEFWSVHP